jgi:hypothetical protein
MGVTEWTRDPPGAVPAKVTWHTQEPAVGPGGDVGGDNQAGEAWTVRLLSDDAPLSMITMYFFADRGPEDYGVTMMTEFLTCTDVSDPGGTETWSDYDYDYEADPLAYDTAEEADEAAKSLAGIWAANPGRHEWDGLPDYR